MGNNYTYIRACKEAVEIYNGACNPCGISASLHEIACACREKSQTTDAKHVLWAPFRVVMEQLHYLMGVGVGGDETTLKDLRQCEDAVKADKEFDN